MRADELLQRGLREMLHEVPPHDDRARRMTMAALATTRQRRHRWLPSIGQTRPPTLPFAIGSAAVLALAVAIGSVAISALRTTPAGPGGSTSFTVPAGFAGQLLCSPTGADTGRLEVVEMSDSRLLGETTRGADMGDQQFVSASAWRIENDDGAWEGSTISLRAEPDGWSTANFVLVGEGAYRGLAAHWILDHDPERMDGRCGWDVQGLIYDADDLPPMPAAAGP